MPNQTQQPPPVTPPATAPLDRDAAVGAIIAAASEAETLHAFMREALVTMLASSAGTFALLELHEGASVFQLEHNAGSQRPDFWRPPLEELASDCLAEKRTVVRLFQGCATGVSVALIAFPLAGGAGAISLIAPCEDAEHAALLRERLEALAALISISASGFDGREAEQGPDAVEVTEAADDAAQGIRRSADFESAVELAITITNRLASREGFEQVALGRVMGKRVKLLAVSGLDHVEKKSESIAVLEQAMHECLDFGHTVAHQDQPWRAPDGEDGSQGEELPLPTGRLHQHWYESAGRVPVATLPLKGPNGVVAILTVRRRPDFPLGQAEVGAIEKMVTPFAAALPIIERANRSLVRHAAGTLLQAPVTFFSRHHVGHKILLLSLLALTAWSWFGSLPYRVSTTSSLSPRATRAIGMPVNARLASAPLAPGARVTKGDILAQFDTESLELESRRIRSELGILEVQENQAVAAGNPIEVQLGQANARELEAQLALIERQIELATVRSPLDGTLVEGDLRERIGDQFAKGEPLFRVADTDSFSLELWIDERDIDVIAIGQAGSFSAFARPERDFELTVTRVSPSAEKHNDTNAFRVEAEVAMDASWARTGMQGIGRIEIDRRRPLWIWLHGVIEGMRMRSWL